MQKYEESLKHYKQSHEIYKSISLAEQNDCYIATTLNNIGLSLVRMQQYEDALKGY